MLKKRNERKKEKKNEKKKRKKIQLKKYNLNIIKKIQQKRGEAKKRVGERGGGAHRKKYLSRVFAWIIQLSLHETFEECISDQDYVSHTIMAAFPLFV